MTIEALIAEWKVFHARPERVVNATEAGRVMEEVSTMSDNFQERVSDLVSCMSFIAGYRAAEKAKVPQ